MLVATYENMEKCKGIEGIVLVDPETMNEYSADPESWFNKDTDEFDRIVYSQEGNALILARKVYLDPLTEDVLGF